MSPTAWTACTVSTIITLKGTSSLHILASFCPRDTTAHTSCRLSMAGENSQTTALVFYSTFQNAFSCLSFFPDCVLTPFSATIHTFYTVCFNVDMFLIPGWTR